MARKSSKQQHQTADDIGIPNDGAAYFQSLENPETIEYVHCKLNDAHFFKVPNVRPGKGWHATELNEELWQGNIKIVDRDCFSGVLLLDRKGAIFAVCPIQDEVERCTDSSRYFVLKVHNSSSGKDGYIGIVFNERTAAFDFNVALETSRKHRESETKTVPEDDTSEEATAFSCREPHVGSALHDNPVPPRALTKPQQPANAWKLPLSSNTNQKGKALEPPKNDTKVSRRKPNNSGGTKVAPTADFASFGSFQLDDEKPNKPFQQRGSSVFEFLCCASY